MKNLYADDTPLHTARVLSPLSYIMNYKSLNYDATVQMSSHKQI